MEETQVIENNILRFESKMKKVLEWGIYLLAFLTPIVFVPSGNVAFYVGKVTFFATLAFVVLIVFLALSISKKILVLPPLKSILLPLLVFLGSALLSSFFSPNIGRSFFGDVLDLGSTVMFFALSMIFVISFFVTSEGSNKIQNRFVLGMIFLDSVIILHLLLRIFSGLIMPDWLTSVVPNFLVGGPLDTAVMLGVLILTIIPILSAGLIKSKKISYLLYGVFIVALLFLGAVNFIEGLVVIGVFALGYTIYCFSWNTRPGGESKPVNYLPMAISLPLIAIFIFVGGFSSSQLSKVFRINVVDIRPNFNSTLEVFRGSVADNYFLGVGPTNFSSAWNLYYPTEVNLSQFWATDFDFGSGFIPTLFVTIGPIGGIAFIVFIAMSLTICFKAVFSSEMEERVRVVFSAIFIPSLFLWMLMFVYSPSLPIVVLTFVLSGACLGLSAKHGGLKKYSIDMSSSQRTSFITTSIIATLSLASIFAIYLVFEKATSSFYFLKGVRSYYAGNVVLSRESIAKAIGLNPLDTYWRGYAGISLAELSKSFRSFASASSLNESEKNSLQLAITESVGSAQNTVIINRNDHLNWMTVGNIYELLAENGLEGALESAENAYREALVRSPKNPSIELSLARLSAIKGDLVASREHIERSIVLKQNYTEGYFALAQLEVARNNIPGAIRSVESAVTIDPQNPNLFFQLGVLKYNSKDYEGSIKAFESAIALVPDYANVKYFLGLSYDFVGRKSDAINQFEYLAASNPDNEEVAMILENLKAGRAPFSSSKLPVDDKPEKRKTLPIEEE